MLTMPLRKQGGAAVLTIPIALMKRLQFQVGESVEMDVQDGTLVLKPLKDKPRKRYTSAELLAGATPRALKALNASTAWAHEGEPVGHELA